MDHFIGEYLIGEVTKVKPYALFLTFEDGSEGLLHISEISDNFIRDIEKYATRGDSVKVKIIAIDEKNGFMRVSYKQVPDIEKFNTHSIQSVDAQLFDNKEFQELEKNLPRWIKETLAKGEN